MTQLTVKLPDDLEAAGDVWLTVSQRARPATEHSLTSMLLIET